jgi:hypothetical protein
MMVAAMPMALAMRVGRGVVMVMVAVVVVTVMMAVPTPLPISVFHRQIDEQRMLFLSELFAYLWRRRETKNLKEKDVRG